LACDAAIEAIDLALHQLGRCAHFLARYGQGIAALQTLKLPHTQGFLKRI
jgi:hypothetical protein